MSMPGKALKISPEGYRRFYKKHRTLLYNLDARIVDENKLLFASMEFLERLYGEVSAYIVDDSDPIHSGSASQIQEFDDDKYIVDDPDLKNKVKPGTLSRTRDFDDDKILNEEDPYMAVLHVLNALLEYKDCGKEQPGLKKLASRFADAAMLIQRKPQNERSRRLETMWNVDKQR